MDSNSFKRILREYFTFSRGERSGIFLLLILLVLLFLLNKFIELVIPDKRQDFTHIAESVSEWEKEHAGNTEKHKYLFPFNPNNIESLMLDSLDLPSNIKRNILKYREAGGKFRDSDDLKRIYGMNDSIFSKIKNFVLIPDPSGNDEIEKIKRYKISKDPFDPNTVEVSRLQSMNLTGDQIEKVLKFRKEGRTFKNSTEFYNFLGDGYTRAEEENQDGAKKPVDTKYLTEISDPIELNSSDSAGLLGINGIGPVFASRIIKYRELLGGFFSPEQLTEVYGLTPETYQKIRGLVFTDTLKIRKIKLNFAEYREFARHPYLSKSQINTILTFRTKNGPFTKPSEVLKFNLVDSATYHRVYHYLTCN